MSNIGEYAVQPRKKDLIRLMNNKDDLSKVAKIDVAMNMLMGIAVQFADEINNTLEKYGLVIGGLKREYKQLDKAFKAYDQVFRSVIVKGTEYKFGDSFIELQTEVEDYVNEHSEDFAELYEHIHALIRNYTFKNFDQDMDSTKSQLEEMNNTKE